MLKEWKSDERKRIRKEVTRQVFKENPVGFLDPISWFILARLIWTVLSVLFQIYSLT